MSDQTLGTDRRATYFTNEAQLTSSAVTENMRLWSYEVCADEEGIQGLQFVLSEKDLSEVSEDISAATLALDPIGIMEGDCSTHRLSSPLRAIKAQSHEGGVIDGLKVNDVNGFKLEFGKGMKSGTIGEDKQWWPFALSAPVIGIYGNHSERGIEKLGFITLDEQCQLALDTAVNPVEEEDDEGEEGATEVDDLNEPVEEETDPQDVEPEEEKAEGESETEAASGEGEEEESSTVTDGDAIVAPEGEQTDLTPAEDPKSESAAGLSTMAKVLIGVGSLLAVALIALAVIMMLKKRAKGENVAQATTAKKPESDLEAGAENPPAMAQN